MKLLKILLNQADYGGYEYNNSPQIVYEAVSNNIDKITQATQDWLEQNIVLKGVLVNGEKAVSHKEKDSLDSKNVIWNKINEQLLKLENEELEISYWNPSNWSESTVNISLRNIESLD